MSNAESIRDIQCRILQIMKYIDQLCRNNNITYYIMGGTALGAIRHKGFIPWDDDLDIFMTVDQYKKFKKVFENEKNSEFILQEWKSIPEYLEYAKVRMNGTTFIEEVYKDRKDMHHGIYVDIMILHKIPEKNFLLQGMVYFCSKYVTLYGLSQRNWKPKTKVQKLMLKSLHVLPADLLAKICYRKIYQYDKKKDNFKYCYWITPAKFKNGIFDRKFFQEPVDIIFEDTSLMCSKYIKKYLRYRYGDYMKLPSKKQRETSVHAMIYDAEKDYRYYMEQ